MMLQSVSKVQNMKRGHIRIIRTASKRAVVQPREASHAVGVILQHLDLFSVPPYPDGLVCTACNNLRLRKREHRPDGAFMTFKHILCLPVLPHAGGSGENGQRNCKVGPSENAPVPRTRYDDVVECVEGADVALVSEQEIAGVCCTLTAGLPDVDHSLCAAAHNEAWVVRAELARGGGEW